MHFKRKTIGKFWPIARKGTKYVAVPDHNQYESLPLVVVIRDMLKLVRTTKELKKLLEDGFLDVRKYPAVFFKKTTTKSYLITDIDI